MPGDAEELGGDDDVPAEFQGAGAERSLGGLEVEVFEDDPWHGRSPGLYRTTRRSGFCAKTRLRPVRSSCNDVHAGSCLRLPAVVAWVVEDCACNVASHNPYRLRGDHGRDAATNGEARGEGVDATA